MSLELTFPQKAFEAALEYLKRKTLAAFFTVRVSGLQGRFTVPAERFHAEGLEVPRTCN